MSSVNDFWREVTRQQRVAGSGVSFNPDAKKESSELERVRSKFRGKSIQVQLKGKMVAAKYDGTYLKNGIPEVSALVDGEELWFMEHQVKIIS